MSISDAIWKSATLFVDATIEEAISNLDKVGIRIILVTNRDNTFVGTVSDGDIRRGLLKGMLLKDPIEPVVNVNALVVPPQMDRDMVMQLMLANKVQQIPIIGKDESITGLHLWDDVSVASPKENIMVIMAGGKGTRLNPHTVNCPKPMLEVEGKPMLKHIVERAQSEGFNNFFFAIHYLGEMIEAYFGTGEKFDISVGYIKEETPLGTAGALSLLEPQSTLPFVVTNGDVITDVSYRGILDFHNRHKADATMAVRVYEWQHPFGVVETDGIEITGFDEKPVIKNYINAGVYVLEPGCLGLLQKNQVCDMPELFERLKNAGKKVLAYPMHEPWLDVGRPEDLDKLRNNEKT